MARWLEEGRFDGRLTRLAAVVHGPIAARSLARPAELPRAVPVVCVGGATLGGSGKTRVAIACARHLAERGLRVILVGHGYRAEPERARIVAEDDELAAVGDEALAASRALQGEALVVVAPRRQEAIDFAVELGAEVILLDGPLQTRPARAWLSLLAVDAERPWGTERLLPAGDLRARPADLMMSADLMVKVDAKISTAGGEPIARLTGRRVGLFTALARPDRIVRALERAGATPSHVVSAPDHGPVTERERTQLLTSPADVWLATEKCALHLEGLRLSAPLLRIAGDLALPQAVKARLDTCRGAAGRPPRAVGGRRPTRSVP